MRLSNYWDNRASSKNRILRPGIALALLCSHSFAQINALSVIPPQTTSLRRNATGVVTVKLRLRQGFHCNSNKPNDEYLIPLKLTWNPGAAEAVKIDYPKPTEEKYPFSDKPMSVYSGEFSVDTTFKVPASAAAGSATLVGKLRYQACDDTKCLPPRTVEVQAPVAIQ